MTPHPSEPAPTYPLDPPLALLQQVWHLSHAIERLSMRMDAALGVTAQQRLTLRCVGKYPGITAGQLAGILQVDPGTVSANVKRLEGRGLLERRRDERDRRRVTLGLTRAGRALNRPTDGTLEHAVELLLHRAPPQDVACMKAMLSQLAELVDDQVPAAPRG